MHRICTTLTTLTRPLTRAVAQTCTTRRVSRMGVSSFLACHRNPQLTSIDTHVLRCEPLHEPKAKTKKWQVVLEDTVIYPEGGGQPSDTGSLKAQADGAEVQVAVLDINRSGTGEAVHVTDRPVQEGQAVTATVDWDRRLDHMQQHTGQHLLSAVVEQLIGADTVSWELHPQQTDAATADTVTVDLTVPDVTPEQIREIESRCNAHIRAAHKINIMWLDNSEKGQAERQRVIEQGNLRGKLPPADVIQDMLRLIEIEGVDINPCGGTHLSCTSQLQVLKIVGVEKSRGQARLRFMVGGRVTAALGASLQRQVALNKVLGCGPADYVSQAQGLQAAKRDLAKANKSLMDELAQLHGRELARQSKVQAFAEQLWRCAGGVACFQRPDADLQYLGWVAAVALEQEPEALLLLASTADDSSGQKGQQQPGVFLLAGPPDAVSLAGKPVAEALGAKGGGRSGRYQGKAPHISAAQIEQAMQHVSASRAAKTSAQ